MYQPRAVAIVENDIIVACALIQTNINYIQNKKTFYLNYVSVKKEYQNRGLGSILLHNIEELAQKEMVDTIEFTSSFKRISAHAFYKKNNYQILDTAYFRKQISKS